jgi:uncharacterized protein YbjT (DUF2867 family)
MMTDAPVLLIGGTRGTGLLIARLLLNEGVPVRVLARDAARATRALGNAPEVIVGDITNEATLPPAISGAQHIVFTAGARSGRFVGEAKIRRTEYDGVVNTLAAARRVGFAGRFLYMNSSGVGSHSFWAIALNIYKGNTLKWRERAERAIRADVLPYTIIRAGVLTNQRGGQHAIELTQRSLPLSPRYRIARADVAAVFVAALRDSRTERATFDVVWGKGTPPLVWRDLFDRVRPDSALASTTNSE